MTITAINHSTASAVEDKPLQQTPTAVDSGQKAPISGIISANQASGSAVQATITSRVNNGDSMEQVLASLQAFQGKTGMTESRIDHADLYKLMFQIAESLRQSAKDQSWASAIAEKTKKLAAIEEKKDAAQTQLGLSLTVASLQLAVAVVSVKASAKKTGEIAKQRHDLGARPDGKPVNQQQQDKLKDAKLEWDKKNELISADYNSFTRKLDLNKSLPDSVIQVVKSVGDYLVELERIDAEQMQVEADMLRQMTEEFKSMATSAEKLIDAVLRIIQDESRIQNQTMSAMSQKI